ncbi:hypothetical protein QRD02_12415 [Aequorivita sp. SDUM287046]|uniref:Sulfatase N-terminal domain-containing protein n=1 Tax=Aequorivita aurantiaca TaxID=3053356 RepID=A0ABT8DMR5_9FLAO|nr:sulfatase-like hydrolase/transferase [Aequorivita aurantiaca]MDN3725185.1 hypothetical protein [Aequorivita aurantiaca]
MKTKRSPKTIAGHLGRITDNPIILGIATGLYPLVFYYSRNFGMSNSWEQLAFFVVLFLFFPIIVFFVLKKISKFSILGKWRKSILPFFNLFIFFYFIKIILYTDAERKIILGIFIVSVLCAYFLHKHFKKWLTVQLVLALIGFIGLLPTIFSYINYSTKWTQQPDDIEEVVFEKRPNIYYIQPDGYVNFSELEKAEYNIDNSGFKSFLEERNFENYHNFRSNYVSTLTSNSATFMMKHHYYNGNTDYTKMPNTRENIVSENAVLSIFKNNGYKTHFISEHPYLLVNRPKLGFDYANFEYNEIPYITTGFNVAKDVSFELETAMASKSDDGNFFFVEIFEPGHISSVKSASKGKEKEREQWLEKREIANAKLEKIINIIIAQDPSALIIIMADHGGFVGLEYTDEFNHKTFGSNIVYSAFGAMLSIRWPNDEVPAESQYLKSSINVFRILFSYVSGNQKYLQHLQGDESYFVLKSGEDPGVYQYVDGNGNVNIKKIEIK